MGLYAGPLGVGEIGLWYALLIMPGILPGYRFTTPFQTVTTAYCVDIDPHEPCMYEWLSKPFGRTVSVRIMRCGPTTLKSAVSSHPRQAAL